MTAWSENTNASQNWTLSYEGDWTDTTKNDGINPAITEARTHSTSHEIIDIDHDNDGGAVTPALPVTHDARGNITDIPTINVSPALKLDWDTGINLLRGIDTNGSGTFDITYEYDARGNRISKTKNGVTTVYVHAGSQVIAEYENGTLVRENIWGGYIDELLAIDIPTTTIYPLQDRRFNVYAITDNTGATTERYSYNAYGRRDAKDANGISITTPAQTRYGYTGREHEDTSGLIYYRSRWYSSEMGRFVSHDIDYLDGLNLYGGYFSMWGGMDASGFCKVCSGETLFFGDKTVLDSIGDGTPGTDLAQFASQRLTEFYKAFPMVFTMDHGGPHTETNPKPVGNIPANSAKAGHVLYWWFIRVSEADGPCDINLIENGELAIQRGGKDITTTPIEKNKPVPQSTMKVKASDPYYVNGEVCNDCDTYLIFVDAPGFYTAWEGNTRYGFKMHFDQDIQVLSEGDVVHTARLNIDIQMDDNMNLTKHNVRFR